MAILDQNELLIVDKRSWFVFLSFSVEEEFVSCWFEDKIVGESTVTMILSLIPVNRMSCDMIYFSLIFITG